jgi:hypothetical protein
MPRKHWSTVGPATSSHSRSKLRPTVGKARRRPTFRPRCRRRIPIWRCRSSRTPYLFDFLGTDAPRREAELEQGLVAHIQKFLLELGQGFAFVGRQVHLEIGEDDFYVDLLFYHLKLRRYVVIELKARRFQPGDGAQLGMYMTAVDRLLCHTDDKPTLGLLLVREKNRVMVEYALGGNTKPISVAEWDTRLT